MKLKQVLAGLLCLLMIGSCAPSQPPEESTSSAHGNPVETESDDTVYDKSHTESEPLIQVPAEGTPGVYFADSFAELREILASETFSAGTDRPVLCITESFPLEEPLVMDRDADIVYLPDTCTWENTLTIRCGEETGILHVSTYAASLLENGCLFVDAPYASLEVVCESLPDGDVMDMYSNVAACNGQDMASGYGGTGEGRLVSVALSDSAVGRPYDGVSLYIRGNTAEVRFPLIVKEKDVTAAKLTFSGEDGAVLYTGTLDLTKANTITTTDQNGKERTYLLTSERLSYDLPVMEIHTDNGEAITEKNTYIHGTLTIDGTPYPMQIRGRGNASWTQFPKKAYRIKLDDGAPLLGLPQNRDWVLVSNYTDKTLIRNCVAHTLAASMSALDYTSTHIPVNLYLNGSYIGVYTFADKIEEGNGRLDLGETAIQKTGKADIGFLLEIGWDFDKENVYNRDYFDTDLVYRIFIKEPEIPQPNTPELQFIKKYILEMENAIVTNNGWENYIDIDSWVDWLIINELTFNMESSFYRSCYLWRSAGDKLKLGPVWDFDMAFGNHYGDLPGYDGWCTTESTYTYISENWMNYLMQYDTFTDRLKERWNEVKEELLQVGLGAVDTYSAMLDGSQQQNFLVWNIMGVTVGAASVNPTVYNTYDKQVQYLRDFINTRWQYMDNRLNGEG
ncbi:MAG: CotH kinase family protein [Clostridia bacterium]|nr:CotH kinase family protein [Clostridia bacterium]